MFMKLTENGGLETYKICSNLCNYYIGILITFGIFLEKIYFYYI